MTQFEQICRRAKEIRRDLKGMEKAHNGNIEALKTNAAYLQAKHELDFLEWFGGCLSTSNKSEFDEDKARELYYAYRF